jgi:tetratricopeptide (TPR) repeat protein
MANFDLENILSQVEQALEAREPARAFAILEPFVADDSQLAREPRLAAVWLTLLRISPGRPGVVEDVRRTLACWPADRALRLAGCDALIRAAELQGPDAPGGSDSPAERAAALAGESLAALTDTERADPQVGGYWLINHANALRLAHHYDDAEPAYQAALALDPNNGDWWFNFGLLCKAQCDFERGLSAAQRARELAGDKRGVLWNIALCATALGRGAQAVEAMRLLGFNARTLDNGMPHVDDLPPLQVRVATVGAGYGFGGAQLDRNVAFELVWVSPASPCHGVVQSATFREASVDYGDVVLWDGTPLGVTQHEGRNVPRFALLSRLRAGDERRMRYMALEQNPGDTQALGATLPNDAQLFVHRAQVEMLCARCASGEHMQKHKHGAPEPHRLVYGKIVVPGDADLASFRSALDACLARHPNVQLVMPGLLEAVGDTRAAGKAHQLWRGLERSALKTGAVAAPRA